MSARRWFLADWYPYRRLGYSRWQTLRVLWRSRRFWLGGGSHRDTTAAGGAETEQQ